MVAYAVVFRPAFQISVGPLDRSETTFCSCDCCDTSSTLSRPLQSSQVTLSPKGPIEEYQERMDQMEAVFGLLFSGPERLLRAYHDRDIVLFRWDTPTKEQYMVVMVTCSVQSTS